MTAVLYHDTRFHARLARTYLRMKKDPRECGEMLSAVFGKDHDSKLGFLKNYKEYLRNGTSNTKRVPL
jgi:hypothetical protein